jgi:solute carrier family 25 protein 39/40
LILKNQKDRWMLPEGTASVINPSGERVDVHPIAKTETVLQKIDSVAKDQRTATLFERMIPGMVGSFISSFLVNPLDVVRIRLQSQGPAISAGYPHLNGTVDGLLNIYKHEGVRALWAGLTPTLTMAVPSTAVYMIMYENFRDYFVKHGIQSDFAPLLAGSIARSIGTFAVSPIEMVRTRMQQGQLEGSLRQVTRRMSLMVQTEGYTYLWKGLTPSLLRDVPFSALYWYGYEKLKSIQLRELDPATEKTWFQTVRIAFLSGALSGMFAAFFTTPFDVAKTRRQMELNNLIDKSVLTSAEQRTVFQILRHVYRVEGYKGLFSGATARMVKVAPASAITISAYEISKRFLNIT